MLPVCSLWLDRFDRNVLHTLLGFFVRRCPKCYCYRCFITHFCFLSALLLLYVLLSAYFDGCCSWYLQALIYVPFFFQHYACQLTKRHEFLRKLKKIDFNTKTVRFLMTLQKRGLEKLDHQPIIRYIGFSQILEHSFNSLETLGGRWTIRQ